MKLKKYFQLLFLFFSISALAQTQYDDLPIAEKIRIKESNAPYLSSAKTSSGSTPVILTTGPEQQCNSAIPVCQNVYTTSASYSGNGTSQEIPSNTCLGSNELNSVWYTFTSSSGGNIAFNITPNVIGQDYDFALYNLTGTNCSAISSGALTPVRCNFSATGGVTGLSSSGTNPSEPASGPNQSTVLATTAGQTYVLIISNYSSSSNGYTLDFTPGTASIFDVTPPTLASVTAPCGSNVLTLNTSEQITCASIAANGSDISISGTGGPYTITNASGVNCGSSTAQIQFTVTPALTGGGPWILNAHSGSDGNSLIDNCGNAMPTTTVSFNVAPATPVITGPSTVCKGSTFALSSSSAISYTWSGAAVPAGQQNNQTISITANNAGTLNFTLVVSYGACGTATVTKAVTVTDAPIANFTALPSQTVCAGTAVTFTNTSTYPCSTGGLGINQCTCGSFLCQTTSNQGTFATYLWTFGDGGTAFYLGGSPASAFSPVHTYTAPGTYNVSLNASGLINTCSNTKNLTITVLPATPALTVSPTTTICPGQSSTLTATGGTTYTWTPGASLNTVSGGTVIATPSITTTYSVSSPGCSGNQTSTVQVVVGGTPPAIGAISGTTTICPNQTGVTYSVTNVSSTNYTWSVPAGATITSAPTNSNAITVNFGASAGIVSVTATGSCGTATAAITVSLNPAISLTVTPASSTVCAGGSTTLSISGATNYTWSPSASLNTSSGSSVIASPTTSTTYTIIGSTGTCTGSTTANITIGGALTLTLTSNTPTVCPGASALLDANGATTYTWFPSSTLSSPNGSNVTASPLGNTTYTVLGSTGTCTGVATISIGIGACVSSSCNLGAIRSALTSAGNIELLGMNNSCSLYFINPQFMTGPQAQAYAQTFGANLISVQSASENADLVQALSNQGFAGQVIWIGYSDATTEGSFVWYDGSPLSYSNWAPGEPNNAGDEDCTQIYPDGSWNDLNCAGYNSLSIIEVNICPQVTVTTPTIHCPGTNVTINASTLLGSPGYTYTWVQSGTETFTNTSSPGNTDQITVTSIAPNTFTVYSEDRYSCPQSAVVSLSVNPLPTVTVNNSTICTGQQTATLTANGASTYSWIPGTGLNSTSGSVVTGTPSTTQNYTVIGTDLNGCISGTTTSITVAPIPTITVNSSSICIGQQTATLTANGANTYSWTPSSDLSASTGSLVTGTPTTTQTYSITGTDINGCFSSATSTIIVNSLPTITVNSSTICVGQQTATLTANGASTYSWIPTANLSSATGSVVTGTPSATESYTVGGMDANGCINATVTAITVNPLPTVTVNSASICVGQQTATLTANGATTYSWIPGTGLSATTGSVVTGTPTVTQTYTVAGADANGCINGTVTAITVNPLPVLVTTANSTVCPLSTNTLTVNGADTYTWSPNVFLNTITASSVICTPSVTTTYTIDATSTDGCTNSNTLSIVVNNSVVVTASAGSPTICPAGSTSLTASGATSYTWSPSLTLNSANGATVTSTTPSTETYTVIGATSTCTNSTQVVVTVTTNPVVSIASSPSVICSGSSAILTASGANTYTWAPSTNLNATTGTTVNANPTTTTTYSIIGASALGCIGTATTDLTVVPTPTITTSANPITICSGKTTTLTANGAANYTWSPIATLSNVNGSSTEASPVLTTTYTVIGTNGTAPFLCTSSNTIKVNAIPNPTVIAGANQIICEGSSALLYAIGANTYTWSPNAGVVDVHDSTTNVFPQGAGVFIYTITGTSSNNCTGTNTLQVTVNPLPTVYAGEDTTINIDNTVTLFGIGSNYVQLGFISGSDGVPLSCNYCPTVTVNPQNSTCYTLEGISSFGCKNTDIVCVTVTKDWNVYIPNAFTPDGDKLNEVFIPVGYAINEIKLTIFDRWGHVVFKSNDTVVGWDGTKNGKVCEQGVYVYQAEITAMSGEKLVKTGHVTLIGKAK